ncbi:hypothetical protein [Corynebacterium belfantii]
MNWVHWWNATRLHKPLGHRTPVEIINSYNQTHTTKLAPI